MSLWVLDTDHVSLFQQNHPIVSSRISAVNSDEIAVTVITVEEQFYGRLNTNCSLCDFPIWGFSNSQSTRF
ncbi:hypothetical protein OSCI_440012 [Kamptonema sp. PCC 6506]|nr:hypothetical protein OSCI_440012 [Kamptonema sp. PCC 6506]